MAVFLTVIFFAVLMVAAFWPDPMPLLDEETRRDIEVEKAKKAKKVQSQI